MRFKLEECSFEDREREIHYFACISSNVRRKNFSSWNIEFTLSMLAYVGLFFFSVRIFTALHILFSANFHLFIYCCDGKSEGFNVYIEMSLVKFITCNSNWILFVKICYGIVLTKRNWIDLQQRINCWT